MIIIGHPWITSVSFRKVFFQKEVQTSLVNEIIVLAPLAESHDLAMYCDRQTIPYALNVDSLKDAVFANALHAKYILCSIEDAKELQVTAQEYLFDTRILVKIEDESEIDAIAKLGIDGVIFLSAIK